MKKTSKGQSLVELMICLLVGGTIVSMTAPSLSALIEGNNTTQTTNQLLGILHYARSEAVFSKRTTAICAGTERCAGSRIWHSQLLVFHDSNLNGQLDPGDSVLRQDILPPGYFWHWSRTSPFLLYERDGTTRALNGTLTLCKEDIPLRQVIISLSGRVRTQAPAASAGCG